MFCDLVGSTALSSRLDPEDLREIIGAYHRCVAQIIAESDGFVSRYMGDGVLVYFGYPQAHEDDAERAVRAGLSAIEAVRRLDVKSVKLQTRVGIATGLVVVGDLIGEGSAQEQSVVGETPNLASRLQGLAEPDTVVIAPSTRRLVRDLFEYRPLTTKTGGFAINSLLEGDGFEPSVPHKKPPFWLPALGPAICLPQQKPALSCRDRWFESISLRGRVRCELDAACSAADYRCEGLCKIAMHRIGLRARSGRGAG